jgi:RNA polymerase sigma-70 factor (ECF subfamily)
MRYIGSKEEALEVLHNGYLKVYQNIHHYNSTLSSLYTWISRIMVNACIDYLRKKKNMRFMAVDDLVKEYEQPMDNLSDKYSVDELVLMINKLPETTRTVFNLYEVEGYSHEEISAFLHISQSTSRWHLTEAKKRLREMIRKNG